MAQWHTLTRTDNAPLLKRVSPDPAQVYINPQDAAAMGAEGTGRRPIATRFRARARDRIPDGDIRSGIHVDALPAHQSADFARVRYLLPSTRLQERSGGRAAASA